MPEARPLNVRSANGSVLVHRFITHDVTPARLSFFLPGGGYGTDGPLLYYPRLQLFANRWDTFEIQYGYHSSGRQWNREFFDEVVEESRGALEVGTGTRDYEQLVVVAKSFGCVVLARLCQEQEAFQIGKAVYLTPPLGLLGFNETVSKTTQPSFFAIGTQDHWYDSEAMDRIRQTRPIEVLEVPGADHSLAVEGNLSGTLEAVERVTEAAVRFIES